MTDDYIRERITQLRIKKNVSEYKMSLDLGHSRSYIQSISSGRAMPSMSEFLYLCEYLGVTPSEFFNESNNNPAVTNKILNDLNKLDDEDLKRIADLVERLAKTK